MKILSMLLIGSMSFASEYPGLSLYNLKSKWINTQAQSFYLNQLAGKKTIISMGYTKCPHACPMIISKIQEIEKAINKKQKTNFKIVMASFDPKGDTPEHLKKYVQGRELDETRWTFLSPPSEKEARELAVALGVSYKRLDDGEYSHSNVIALLNEEGVVVSKIDNLNADIAEFVAQLEK